MKFNRTKWTRKIKYVLMRVIGALSNDILVRCKSETVIDRFLIPSKKFVLIVAL